MVSAEPVTVATLGFNVPCRQFLLTANVTRDRRLPVVDEFVLRLLRLCEVLPANRMASYFRFTDSEMRVVLGELGERGLVVVDGDNVSLHSSAYAMFRGSDDGAPQVVEVDSWVDRIWFDLVSRNMIRPSRIRPLKYLVDIPASSSARDLPVSYARKAFEENFASYLRDVKRIAAPDRFSLYSVSDAQPLRFGSVVLKADEELVFDPNAKLRPTLLKEEIGEAAEHVALLGAMHDAYRKLSHPDPSLAARDDYRRLTLDKTVDASMDATGAFDLARWLSVRAREQKTRALIGATYLPKNIDAIVGAVGEALALAPLAQGPNTLEITWYRPGGTIWGASPDLQDALARIRSTIRVHNRAATVRSRLIIPQAVRHTKPGRFERVFDEAFVAPAGHISSGIEILSVSGLVAAVLVTVPFSGEVGAPVGLVVSGRSAVERIEGVLQSINQGPRAEKLWSKARGEELTGTEGPLVAPEIYDE
jgi:hypothetical protein